MNLLQIRTKFRQLSGRFDLVNEDFSDNGADFFINEGRKFLDRLDETQKSWASCFRSLSVGSFAVTFPYCRAVKEVWLSSSVEGRWQLDKESFQTLLVSYLADVPSTRSTGTPYCYSPCITRYIPENATVADINAIAGFVEIPAGNAHHYNAILLSSPVDQQLVVEIKGLFYSMELVEDTDANYWSEVHPMLLYMSAMRQIEIANRNTQGVKDWEASIGFEMKQIGMDLVEEEISGVSQMEG